MLFYIFCHDIKVVVAVVVVVVIVVVVVAVVVVVVVGDEGGGFPYKAMKILGCCTCKKHKQRYTFQNS